MSLCNYHIHNKIRSVSPVIFMFLTTLILNHSRDPDQPLTLTSLTLGSSYLLVLVPGDALRRQDKPKVFGATLHEADVVEREVALPNHLQTHRQTILYQSIPYTSLIRILSIIQCVIYSVHQFLIILLFILHKLPTIMLGEMGGK